MNETNGLSAWCDEAYAPPRHERCPGTVAVPTDRFEANPDSTIPTLRRVTEQQPCGCPCHDEGSLW